MSDLTDKTAAVELAAKEGITVAAAAAKLGPKPSFKAKPKPKVTVDAEKSEQPAEPK